MRNLIRLLILSLIVTGCKNGEEKRNKEREADSNSDSISKIEDDSGNMPKIEISPVSHATAIIKWNDAVFYTDPVGRAEAFASNPEPDFILITDIHGDHLSIETLKALEPRDTKIIVPQAVKEKLSKDFQNNLIVINNGETVNHRGFQIEAIPMYNLPQSRDAMHVKGRGNGYVLEKNGERLYISGDTEDIPEMRSLKNIDIALVSMNLPYTMTVEQAADAVLEFKPRKVIPYHYRGKKGFSDIDKFKSLVKKGNKSIEVELMEWYPGEK